MWGEVRKDVWEVEKCGEGCGRVYGVSGEVCWRVGEGCGERNGGGVGNCVRVWGPNTLPPTLPHISSLTSLPSPFPTSLTSPIPKHTFLHLLSYLFPHFPFFQHTFLHLSPHLPKLLKVWRNYHVTKFPRQSYHVTKFLWRSCLLFIWTQNTCSKNTFRLCDKFTSFVNKNKYGEPVKFLSVPVHDLHILSTGMFCVQIKSSTIAKHLFSTVNATIKFIILQDVIVTLVISLAFQNQLPNSLSP